MTRLSADARAIVDAIEKVRREGKRQRVFVWGDSDPTSGVSSTTDTVNYGNAFSVTWTEPPPGIYVVRQASSLLMSHSTSGSVNYKNNLDGVDGQVHTNNATPDAVSCFRSTDVFLDVEITEAGLVLLFKIKAGTAGTVISKNPAMDAIAVLVRE